MNEINLKVTSKALICIVVAFLYPHLMEKFVALDGILTAIPALFSENPPSQVSPVSSFMATYPFGGVE